MFWTKNFQNEPIKEWVGRLILNFCYVRPRRRSIFRPVPKRKRKQRRLIWKLKHILKLIKNLNDAVWFLFLFFENTVLLVLLLLLAFNLRNARGTFYTFKIPSIWHNNTINTTINMFIKVFVLIMQINSKNKNNNCGI